MVAQNQGRGDRRDVRPVTVMLPLFTIAECQAIAAEHGQTLPEWIAELLTETFVDGDKRE